MDFCWSWLRTKGRDYRNPKLYFPTALGHVCKPGLSGGDEALKHLARVASLSSLSLRMLEPCLRACSRNPITTLAIPLFSPCRAVSSECVSHSSPFSPCRRRLTSLNPPALGFRSSCTTLNCRKEDIRLCLSLCLSVSSSQLILHVGAPQLACIGFEVWRHLRLLIFS